MLEAISAKDIAVSGLKTQRVRMNLIANNIANALTTRTPEGGAFRRQLAIVRGEQLGGVVKPEKLGVRVTRIVRDPSPLRSVYDPGHPDADAEGYVMYPNVNLAVEMVDLISAQRAFEANIAVILSERRMVQQALEIIRV
jgi:flagellar basal-body rod protein FlgC